MSEIEAKLRELGFSLPETTKPTGTYEPSVRVGNLVFVAGAIPRRPDGSLVTGKLGQELTVEQGYEAARLCVVDMLANLKYTIDDLDKVKRVVRVLGMVNATPEFAGAGRVVNGFSDLLVTLFGDRGRHTRSSIGISKGPGIALEVETVVEVAD